jgi:arylsulfatase A-like enzyme
MIQQKSAWAGVLALSLLGAALPSLTCCSGEAGAPRARKPNVILILTDDQGYGDLSCHGNPVLKTPCMDELHAQGVRLTECHSDPSCSPSRASLMTGRYSARAGVWHTVQGRSILRANEVTMADIFARNGYRTGLFGKWHLGDSYPFRPQERGFQEVLTFGGGGIGNSPDFWGNDYFDDTYLRNGTPEAFKGYCTDVWFEQATRFIRDNRERPFFCYLPLNAPHKPCRAPEQYVKPYLGKVPEPRARFYGMIANIDKNLGRLRRELRTLGLEQDTILLFLSDNGTEDGAEFDDREFPVEGYNDGMRGMKISEYDGGHRVPCFFYWPGGGISGGRNVGRLSATFDFLPTLIDLCGLAPPNVTFDGISLAPWLRGSEKPDTDGPGRTLVVHNQREIDPVKGKNYSVMTDRWRCVNGRELYAIKADPGQRNDLSKQHPEVVADLRKAYEAWWRDVSVDFDKPARMVLGSDRANPTSLNPHDWLGKPYELFAQSQVLKGRPRAEGKEFQGHWLVEVARDGRYEIEFRRWPRELNLPITAGFPGGTALPATQAKVKIGAVEQTLPVAPDAAAVTFCVELKAGPATLEGWFIDEPSGKARGPFYVSVKRVE